MNKYLSFKTIDMKKREMMLTVLEALAHKAEVDQESLSLGQE